jgi:hypothetical protein
MYFEPTYQMTVCHREDRAAAAESRQRFLSGGFVSDKDNKKTWIKPRITHFADVEELWRHYRFRGTPDERERLRSLIDFATADISTQKKRRRA